MQSETGKSSAFRWIIRHAVMVRFIPVVCLLAVWTAGLSACGDAGGPGFAADGTTHAPAVSSTAAPSPEGDGIVAGKTPEAATPSPEDAAAQGGGEAATAEPSASPGLPEGFLPEETIEIPAADTENRFRKTDEVYFREGANWREAVELNRIESNLWMHVSYTEQGDRLGASNGLVLFQERDALLVNTPGNAAQTNRLLEIVRSQFGVEVTAALLTSAEAACSGGVDALHMRKIPVYALASVTASLPVAVRPNLQSLPVMSTRLVHGDRELVLIQPDADGGPQDSLLWLPQDRALYSRSLVLPESTPLPETAGADLLWAWRDFLGRWMISYDETELFIPGSGEWGTRSMIDLLMARISERLPKTMTRSAIELFPTFTDEAAGTPGAAKNVP